MNPTDFIKFFPALDSMVGGWGPPVPELSWNLGDLDLVLDLLLGATNMPSLGPESVSKQCS